MRNAQTRIAELRRQQHETTAQAEASRDALAGGRARKASVEQILNDRSYTAEAVQKLFASNQGSAGSDGFRAVGVLADYAEVEQQYESAVEQFLRDELEYVVVETFDVARAGIAMLREDVGGRATFFVDSLRKLNIAVQRTGCSLRDRKANRFPARSPGGIPRSSRPGSEAIPAPAAIVISGGRGRDRGAPGSRKSSVLIRYARWDHVSGPRRQRRTAIRLGPAGHEARTALARCRSIATGTRGFGSAGGTATHRGRTSRRRANARTGHCAARGIGEAGRRRNVAPRSGARRHGSPRDGTELLPDRTCALAQRCHVRAKAC